MAEQGLQYYRPYDSADESGSDSGSESTDSWFSQGYNQQSGPTTINSDGIPNFRAFATQVQLLDAGGKSFSTIQEQLKYNTDKIGKYTVFSQYDTAVPDLSGERDYGKTRFETADGEDTNLIMIDSRYRDRTAYPQPTYFSIRLPRTYTKIKGLNFAEVKLLNSFYYFRNTKGNTDLSIYEQGRTTYNNVDPPYSTIVKSYIREGTYTIYELLTELTTQLNYTPLFFDYINGFNDFIGPFKASGDYFLNFNQPGDTFYNTMIKSFVPNPSINTIVLHFWNNRYAGLSSYTNNQALLAYYYPVLVEYINDSAYSNREIDTTTAFGIDPTITSPQDVINRILYTFTGINPIDSVVLAVVQANIPLLDKYRVEHTFRYYLINKYDVNIQSQNQTVYFTTNGLNTSLNNTIATLQSKYFNQALTIYGITSIQYNTLLSNKNAYLAILQGMYSFTQSNFLNYFAVPWSQYTLDYYGNLDWQIQVRDGIGAIGLPTNDSEANAANIVGFSTNIISILQNEPTYLWPNLSNANYSTIHMINLSSISGRYSTVNHVYNMNSYTINPRETITKLSNYLYTDYLTNTANVVCPIEAAKYTVFQFCSPVRQTLQIETLPRPTLYRLPVYNQSNYDSTINTYFDYSYTFSTFTSTYPYKPFIEGYAYAYDNVPSTIITEIPGWGVFNASSNSSNYSWQRSYNSSFYQEYSSNITITINTYNRALYFQFTAPEVQGGSITSNYTYDLNLSIEFYQTSISSNAGPAKSDGQIFLYHDRGAFQGDILNSLSRNETPFFYKYLTPISSNDTSATIQFTAYQNQTYYVVYRPNFVNFGSTHLRVAPWFSNVFTITPQSYSIEGINPQTDIYSSNFSNLVNTNFNYAQVYDSNWIQLPINSNLFGPNPSSNSGNNQFGVYTTPIGYDTNDISTDFTDYIPYKLNSSTITFNPTNTFGIDPINFYQFEVNSVYNSTTQTYFYPKAFNYLYLPGIENTYSPATVPIRQIKIVHYYSVNYLPESDLNYQFTPGMIGPYSNAQLPYTLETTGTPIPGYSYGGGTQSTIQLSRGTLGFNFIPQNGIWDINRIVFRSAIEDSNNDPNSNIMYLGVYTMDTLINNYTDTLSLSTAICVLYSSARTTYTSTITSDTYSTDIKGGTYYEFRKDTSFLPQGISSLYGYVQYPGIMSDQPESMYSVIAFSKYGSPLTIKALSGSAIPYPYYNSISTSTQYLDGTKAYNRNLGVIYPGSVGQTAWPFATSISSIFAPPPGGDVTQSQYQLSMPIGTSVVNFKTGSPVYQDPNFVYPWSNTLSPSLVIGTVKNYILFQDTNIQIYQYDLLDPVRTLREPTWSIAADQIYPSYENTSLVGITGNSSYYYFLGFENNFNINYTLRLKRYHPQIGVLYDYPLQGPSFIVPTNGLLKSFTMNDKEQMVLCYQDTATNTTKLYYSLYASTSMTYVTIPGNKTATHSMDPQTSTCYWISLDPVQESGSSIFQWSIDSAFPGVEWTPTTQSGSPSSWSYLAVNGSNTVPSTYDRIFLISKEAAYASTIFYSSNWDTTTTTIQLQTIGTTIPIEQANPGLTVTTGYNGGLWITANGPQTVWGTRNTEPDINGFVDGAWQIFYPFQKIVLEKISNSYNSITDLTSIDYPEYPHVQSFYYSNTSKFLEDTTNKWGLESKSNFTVSDVQLSGYYFNTYMFNVPIRKSVDSNDFQYIALRGLTPTESSETLFRIIVSNKYDFGYTSQIDLFNEISTFQNPTSRQYFSGRYADVLKGFDASYQQSNIYFGQDLIPNFQGSSINTKNFQEFATNYSTIYGLYNLNTTLLTTITEYVTSNTNNYINSNFQYIFPAGASNRQALTSPFTFQILWKSTLLPQYAALLENWGLGYNLGFIKADTPSYTTFTISQSFYRILDDYIYLRLNPEYKMNRMDSTAAENLNITRDSTGQVDQFYGKLLLNNFNSYCTTFVSNQAPFNPPIGRLDMMYFQWVDIGGTQLNDTQCEWGASLTITEIRTKATLASTLPTLPPMAPLRK